MVHINCLNEIVFKQSWTQIFSKLTYKNSWVIIVINMSKLSMGLQNGRHRTCSPQNVLSVFQNVICAQGGDFFQKDFIFGVLFEENYLLFFKTLFALQRWFSSSSFVFWGPNLKKIPFISWWTFESLTSSSFVRYFYLFTSCIL